MVDIPIGLKINGYRVILTNEFIKVNDKQVNIESKSTSVVVIDIFTFYIYRTDCYVNVNLTYDDEILTLRLLKGKK